MRLLLTILKAIAIVECIFLFLFILWILFVIGTKLIESTIPEEKKATIEPRKELVKYTDAEGHEWLYFSKGERI